MTTVFIQDSPLSGSSSWLEFKDCSEILKTDKPSEVKEILKRVESAVAAGLYAAGYVTYEAAPGFDPALDVHEAARTPLVWFALFSSISRHSTLPASPEPIGTTIEWQPCISESDYLDASEDIRNYLESGDTYQVNYTFQLIGKPIVNNWNYFLNLQAVQQGCYGAYIDTGEEQIMSCSPELFFRRDKSLIYSRPMKGTARRGATSSEDEANKLALTHSEKNMAENIMIVDMVRNDIGRIAEPGSVAVEDKFQIESYPTVHQMTTTVTGTTTASIADIFSAMFPCASITGAPKCRSMQIIKECEPRPRGVYTGSIGFVLPDGTSQFSVAIRTVSVDLKKQHYQYGTGSGIVWDSEPSQEYQECLAKTQILTKAVDDFGLLETILWEPDKGYFLIDEHLDRLRRSCLSFGVTYDDRAIVQQLTELEDSFDGPHRVRLVLGLDKTLKFKSDPFTADPDKIWRVALDTIPSRTTGPFCVNKTTRRGLYEAAMSRHTGYDDVLMWNPKGEITETTMTNVVFRIKGELVTPSLESGLLPGTFRQHLLKKGEIVEKILTKSDLDHAEEIVLINSVRKWIKAVIYP